MFYYAHLSAYYHVFVFSIASHLISKSGLYAMSYQGCRVPMEDEMHALEQNEIWELAPPTGKKAVGY